VPKIRKPTQADISAVLSNDVVVRKVRNQTVISTITIPRKSTSTRKQQANKRFAKANQWAKMILTQPGMMELYSKGVNSKLSNAHTVAVVDFLNAPEIHYISLKQHTGAVGDKIRIKATDDFHVTTVDVTIIGKNGKQLEKGPAIRYKRKPAMWIYTLTVANPDISGTIVEVTARDRPGNTVVNKETAE
jgi:hypothetical protein